MVNQVTTQIKREDTVHPPSSHLGHAASTEGHLEVEGEDARSRVAVALGNTWAHQVNTRLVMEFLTNKLRKVSCYHGNNPATISQGGLGRASCIGMMHGAGLYLFTHWKRHIYMHSTGALFSVLGSTVACRRMGGYLSVLVKL